MWVARHAQVALSTWERLKRLAGDTNSKVLLDGEALSIADVVAIARHGQKAKIDDSPAAIAKINNSVAYLTQLLDQGYVFYGVNTGFGGSANTRSADKSGLQIALMQMQQCGVLSGQSHDAAIRTCMPETWVRAATVVRCNTLIRGHSAVRYPTIKMLELLLNEDCTPLVPLRGSISASGDLSPLSYIAGVLEGNPKLSVWIERDGSRTLVDAGQALKQLQLSPISFGPKEALGMINGTAVSTAVAALALHEVHQLAVLSQILTAMGVEALRGTNESFHPFLAQVRPHAGQVEAAHNISGFLRGSRLATERISLTNLQHSDTLPQDRYPLRTSTQWIGPLLEDLVLAHQQINTELNSTTDNPIIDIRSDRVLHGGNFQAVAVTSAMDKARSALQMMGKMLFAQCTEIMNGSMSNGLPPNLVFDEPSISYTFKGIDIAIAAYTSELGFLAHPVGPYVQSAEMGNQAINSLALLSARYTHTAIDTFSMLAASCLYSLCQALDLRVMEMQFHERIYSPMRRLTEDSFGAALAPQSLDEMQSLAWSHVIHQFGATTTKDSTTRFQAIAESTQAIFMTYFSSSKQLSPELLLIGLQAIPLWTACASTLMRKHFDEVRQAAVNKCNTPAYLGTASRMVYEHVRGKMGISLNRGLVDHPLLARARLVDKNQDQTTATSRLWGGGELIGDCVSRIYDSLRSGDLMVTMMECLANVTNVDNLTSSSR